MKKPRYTVDMVNDIRDPSKNIGLNQTQVAAKHTLSTYEVAVIRALPAEVFILQFPTDMEQK
jgi:hypothetical protein